MRNRDMGQEMRHVGIGFLLGLLCLVFGVFWAAYLTVSQDAIHAHLSQSARAALEEKFIISPGHEDHGAMAPDGRAHGQDGLTDEAPKGATRELPEIRKEPAARAASGGSGFGPAMRAAHERLSGGHLHAMGLGVLTISVSLVLAFVPAPPRVKTVGAACLGTGSFFYPFAWIIMGFRTTALGEAAAQGSVMPMAVFSMALVAAGLLISLACVMRWLLRVE